MPQEAKSENILIVMTKFPMLSNICEERGSRRTTEQLEASQPSLYPVDLEEDRPHKED